MVCRNFEPIDCCVYIVVGARVQLQLFPLIISWSTECTFPCHWMFFFIWGRGSCALHSHSVSCLVNTALRKMRLYVGLRAQISSRNHRPQQKCCFSWRLSSQRSIGPTSEGSDRFITQLSSVRRLISHTHHLFKIIQPGSDLFLRECVWVGSFIRGAEFKKTLLVSSIVRHRLSNSLFYWLLINKRYQRQFQVPLESNLSQNSL